MNNTEDKRFIEPPNIISDTVTAIFTTRAAESIADEINISENNIYLPIQKHTDRVHVLESGMEPVVADAILTKRRGVLIGVQVADCVPVLLLDMKNQVVGAVHAGWRGTSKQILRNTIDTMKKKFSSSADDIMVAIGPCIRGCCYEVAGDVRDAVEDATGEGAYCMEKDGKYYLDLSSANLRQAVSSGIPQANIWRSGECTRCNHEKFYSYRYANGTTGRQGGFIGMW
jgi:YfiH family protein